MFCHKKSLSKLRFQIKLFKEREFESRFEEQQYGKIAA